MILIFCLDVVSFDKNHVSLLENCIDKNDAVLRTTCSLNHFRTTEHVSLSLVFSIVQSFHHKFRSTCLFSYATMFLFKHEIYTNYKVIQTYQRYCL